MKRYIYLLLASCMSVFTLQSCFQDMDHPAFDYPESGGEQANSPLKMFLTFDNEDIRDKGDYGFLVADNGNVKFSADGISGMAYQGAEDAYALARTPSSLMNVIPDLGSCTLAFWMKSDKNTSAQGIFSIPNTKTFWGNFDLFLENNSSPTQAFFKLHLYNTTSVKENDERWIEARVEDVFINDWVHLAFVYDEQLSALTIYRNGESVLVKELPGYGKLKFKDVGASLAIGAFQFSTKPSLTEGAGAQSWAKNYAGLFDQFRFYGEAVSADEIRQLYTNKE